MLEKFLRESLRKSAGGIDIFFTRPICLAFLALTIAFLLMSRKLSSSVSG